MIRLTKTYRFIYGVFRRYQLYGYKAEGKYIRFYILDLCLIYVQEYKRKYDRVGAYLRENYNLRQLLHVELINYLVIDFRYVLSIYEK